MSGLQPITLWAHDGPGPNPPKVALLLEALHLPYEVKAIPFGEAGVKGPEFLKINPNGRVPAILDPNNNNRIVWESGAILFYLANQYDKSGKYFGKNLEEQTDVMIWLTHQLSGLGPAQGQVNWFIHYHEGATGEAPGPSIHKRYRDECIRLFGVIEQQLTQQEAKGSQFIALDRVTIADYAFYAWLRILKMAKLDEEYAKFPRAQKWLDTLNKLPEVEAAYKKVK